MTARQEVDATVPTGSAEDTAQRLQAVMPSRTQGNAGSSMPVDLPLAVARTPLGALQQLPLLASRALSHSTYRVRKLGLGGVGGILMLLAAGGLFVFHNLREAAAVAALRAQVGNLVSSTPAHAARPIAKALGTLPARDDAATVVERIREQAQASGIELTRGQYEFLPARDGVAARYRMTFPLRTSYPKLRDFMDHTLIALPAVAVEGLHIERKSVGDGDVDADLTLSAYVRDGE